MPSIQLSRLSSHALLQCLKALILHDHAHTAELIAHLAEVERRKLYRPAGYPSMFVYCVHELRMSEAVAYKRIRAARMARRFPMILDAIADGRLHLDAVKLLAKHVNAGNVRELTDAATHRTSREIELLLAKRFPSPDMPTVVRPLLPSVFAMPLRDTSTALEPSSLAPCADVTQSSCELAARPVVPMGTPVLAPEREGLPSIEAHARVAPLAPGRFGLQVTLSQHTHDFLRRAQELLAQAQPGCDIANVLDRALQELVNRLEHHRFGDTDIPRARRASCDTRYIPAQIRRQVAERDGKRCTFMSADGKRCPERACLEYDHVEPVARGGRSTVHNLRLRCRAHNQYEAEQIYGEGFMHAKRGAGQSGTSQVREKAGAYSSVPSLVLMATPELTDSTRDPDGGGE